MDRWMIYIEINNKQFNNIMFSRFGVLIIFYYTFNTILIADNNACIFKHYYKTEYIFNSH